jgi:hypothetical protein
MFRLERSISPVKEIHESGLCDPKENIAKSLVNMIILCTGWFMAIPKEPYFGHFRVKIINILQVDLFQRRWICFSGLIDLWDQNMRRSLIMKKIFLTQKRGSPTKEKNNNV